MLAEDVFHEAIAVESETSTSGSRMLSDLTSGTVAGVAQLLVGHPFDTIKVKLQSQGNSGAYAQYNGPVDAARQTLSKEGLKGMYKGMGAPLATVALFNAVLFASRGQMESWLAHSDGSPLTMRDHLIAAIGASCAVSLVATPTELMKCRLQAQGSYKAALARLLASGLDPSTAALYRGPMDVARRVVRNEAGWLGLYTGQLATLGREVPGNMAMFGVYELVKHELAKWQGLSDTSQLGQGSLLLAGGLGGSAFWCAAYPIDVVKSKLQVDSYTMPAYRGLRDCARKVYAAEGFAGFWRGFGPALARSFPANAVCFAVYEAMRSMLHDTSPTLELPVLQ